MKTNWNTITDKNKNEMSKMKNLLAKVKEFTRENKKHLIGASVSTAAMLLVAWWINYSNPDWNFSANLLFPWDEEEIVLDDVPAAPLDIEIPGDLNEVPSLPWESSNDDLFWEIEDEPFVIDDIDLIDDKEDKGDDSSEDDNKSIEDEIDDLFWWLDDLPEDKDDDKWEEEVEEKKDEEIKNEEKKEVIVDEEEEEEKKEVKEDNPFEFKENPHTTTIDDETNYYWFKENTHTVDVGEVDDKEEDFYGELEEEDLHGAAPAKKPNNTNLWLIEPDDWKVTWILYKNYGRIPYYFISEKWKKLFLDTTRNLNSEIWKEITVFYSWNFESFIIEKILANSNQQALNNTWPWAILFFSVILSWFLSFYIRRKVSV